MGNFPCSLLLWNALGAESLMHELKNLANKAIFII
jgi:hypothetical protein